MRSQRERLVGERGQKRTGYSRREKYLSEDGWDTKYGMHMIRLGIQGIELLTERRITLPMPEADRSVVMEIREGKWPVDNVVMLSHTLEEKLLKLAEGGVQVGRASQLGGPPVVDVERLYAGLDGRFFRLIHPRSRVTSWH